MAKTKYPTPLVAGDLLIDICPRGADEWTGTRTQIESEGVLQGLDKWPEGKEKSWDFGPFRYWLHVRRPPKSKDGEQPQTDYWWLRRRLIAYGYDGFATAARHEKLCALAEAKWRLTPESDQQERKACEARCDKAFASFMRVATGQANASK